LRIRFDVADAATIATLAGTGTPEPGGIDWQTCESLLQALSGENIVALDIMELAPTLDQSEVSSVLAAKLLREWILLISNRAQRRA